jgi:predicted aspartyl protease
MSISVDYDGSHGFITGRPHADIACHGTSRAAKPYCCPALVDTGADYLTLPNDVAELLGIDLSPMTKTRIATASGVTLARIVDDFYVEIEGALFRVRAQFTPNTPVLLGLNAILSAMDIGVNPSDWLYKL